MAQAGLKFWILSLCLPKTRVPHSVSQCLSDVPIACGDVYVCTVHVHCVSAHVPAHTRLCVNQGVLGIHLSRALVLGLQVHNATTAFFTWEPGIWTQVGPHVCRASTLPSEPSFQSPYSTRFQSLQNTVCLMRAPDFPQPTVLFVFSCTS